MVPLWKSAVTGKCAGSLGGSVVLQSFAEGRDGVDLYEERRRPSAVQHELRLSLNIPVMKVSLKDELTLYMILSRVLIAG